MWSLRAGLMGFLALSAAACGASHAPAEVPAPERGAPSTRQEEPAPRGIPVVIDNQNFSDMTIYLLSGGTRWLLGEVGGFSKGTLQIPTGIARGDAQVRLLADPVGATLPMTTPMLVVPQGQKVYWTIGSDEATSSASAG
jgi:hypothetical protein